MRRETHAHWRWHTSPGLHRCYTCKRTRPQARERTHAPLGIQRQSRRLLGMRFATQLDASRDRIGGGAAPPIRSRALALLAAEKVQQRAYSREHVHTRSVRREHVQAQSRQLMAGIMRRPAKLLREMDVAVTGDGRGRQDGRLAAGVAASTHAGGAARPLRRQAQWRSIARRCRSRPARHSHGSAATSRD